MGWFTIRQIDSDTFAISELGHWQRVHSYLLLGTERAALIDSGTGIGNISSAVAELTSLPVSVITSHCHWDHIGGHKYYSDLTVHAAERHWLEQGVQVPLERLREMLLRRPFACPPPPEFSIDAWQPFTGSPNRVAQDGDVVELGRRRLTLLHTPGHSPGHMCVLDESRGYLAAADLIYDGTLVAFMKSSCPTAFRDSIDRIVELAPTRILPGHNDLTIDPGYPRLVAAAFHELADRGELRKGTGLHRFDGFKIRL